MMYMRYLATETHSFTPSTNHSKPTNLTMITCYPRFDKPTLSRLQELTAARSRTCEFPNHLIVVRRVRVDYGTDWEALVRRTVFIPPKNEEYGIVGGHKFTKTETVQAFPTRPRHVTIADYALWYMRDISSATGMAVTSIEGYNKLITKEGLGLVPADAREVLSMMDLVQNPGLSFVYFTQGAWSGVNGLESWQQFDVVAPKSTRIYLREILWAKQKGLLRGESRRGLPEGDSCGLLYSASNYFTFRFSPSEKWVLDPET